MNCPTEIESCVVLDKGQGIVHAPNEGVTPDDVWETFVGPSGHLRTEF